MYHVPFKNRKRNSDDFSMKMPLFFKLWFAFILISVVSIFAVVGFTFYKTATMDPAEIGKFVGKVQFGYEQSISNRD